MHCVDLGESFPTNIYLQNLASIPKHFLKLAASASQPAIRVNPAYFQISLSFNLQISNSQIPNFQLYPNSLPFFNFSDPSDLLRSLTIGSDPSDPFRSLRSLRSLRSIPIPLIRVISSTHTHCQYLSFLSLRMLVIVRTSFTRGARLGTRAGTCTAENEPYYFEISSSREIEFELRTYEPLICNPARSLCACVCVCLCVDVSVRTRRHHRSGRTEFQQFNT